MRTGSRIALLFSPRVPNEAAGPVRPVAHFLRCRRAGGGGFADRRKHLALASRRDSRQQRVDPDHHRWQSRQRRAVRADASDARPVAVSATDAGAGGAGGHLGQEPADAPVRAVGSDPACRRQLLLARAHARARAAGNHARRAVPVRRGRSQHGRRRMLDLRYLAAAPRAQPGQRPAHPPGRRHRRWRPPVGSDQQRARAGTEPARLDRPADDVAAGS